jgi:hypothetical protein
MLRLLQLIYGSNPSTGSFDRAEINSRRPLAPFFLNRISRTESMFCPQLPADQSFAGATRARASFSPLTLMSLIFYPQLQRNQSFGRRSPPQPIDSKPLAHKSFLM